MAAIGQYLMEKNAEIQLARSAAPDSISRDATQRTGAAQCRLRDSAGDRLKQTKKDK